MSDFKRWLASLTKQLRGICHQFVDDKDQVKMLFSRDKLCLWVTAFTQISSDVNNSYETLEHLGDRVCDWAFKAYVIHRYPNKHVPDKQVHGKGISEICDQEV